MYSIQRHGDRHRLPCLELELNQSCIVTGRGIAAMAESVATAVRKLVCVRL
jgi:hypothetical protein